MIKKISVILVFCFLVLCLCSCSDDKGTLYTTQPTTTTPETTHLFTVQENIIPTQVATMPSTTNTTGIAVTEAFSDMVTQLPPATVPVPSDTPQTQEAFDTTTKTYEKTGEMEFSDNADNRYIASISQKYNVPADRLVALYTVPENDSNIVLEFDGTTNENGSLVRNKSTLIAIYSIDKALNSKRASEDSKLNEYSYGEMKVMFFATTSHIMPEFEELR